MSDKRRLEILTEVLGPGWDAPGLVHLERAVDWILRLEGENEDLSVRCCCGTTLVEGKCVCETCLDEATDESDKHIAALERENAELRRQTDHTIMVYGSRPLRIPDDVKRIAENERLRAWAEAYLSNLERGPEDEHHWDIEECGHCVANEMRKAIKGGDK